jgi:hypothetical protein
MVSACCFDYASFYEYIPKPISEVAGSATWWRGEFHYNLDHGFGEVTTCFNADIHGRLLQAVQQHHIDKVTVVPGSIVLDRRTDDTLMLINRAGIPDAPRAIKAFKRVCTTAGQPLQDSKEQLMQTVFIFDGLAYDLMAKAIGYPRSKQAKLLPVLAQALNISRTRALNDVPAHARDEMAIIFDAVGFTAGKLSRRECERLTGAIEFSVIALVHLRARVPPIRQSYLHVVGDDTRVTFSTEATSCLRLLYNLYTRLDTIWFPLRNLFEHQPDFDIYTDASGKFGFGGYGPGIFFAHPLREDWNLHLADYPADLSTAFLELGALHLFLYAKRSHWQNKVIRWRTDSLTAVLAWRNGRSPSPPLNRLLWAVQKRCSLLSLFVVAEHLPRAHNTLADDLSNLQVAKFLSESPQHRPSQRFKPPVHALEHLESALSTPSPA